MSKLTRAEAGWIKKLNNLMEKCPSNRIGFFVSEIDRNFIGTYNLEMSENIDNLFKKQTKEGESLYVGCLMEDTNAVFEKGDIYLGGVGDGYIVVDSSDIHCPAGSKEVWLSGIEDSLKDFKILISQVEEQLSSGKEMSSEEVDKMFLKTKQRLLKDIDKTIDTLKTEPHVEQEMEMNK
tara:strand:- start:2182 stop:2718 length:537 start_codon:yes stop_codon:yes gene_type:complete